MDLNITRCIFAFAPPFCEKETLFFFLFSFCVSFFYGIIGLSCNCFLFLYARDEGLPHLYTQAAQTLNVITLVCNIMLLVIVLQFLMLGAFINLAYLSLHCFSVSVFLEGIRT